MISDIHRCIFIHIPKTGGSTVEEMFRMNGFGNIPAREVHLSACLLQKRYPEKFLSYYKFSIVRNPWARAYSVWWNYVQSGKTKQTLYEFCNTIHTRFLLVPQFDMLSAGENVIDYIGRFEELNDVLSFVIEKFGLVINDIPHQKKREGKPHYTDFFDDKTIELIAKRYNKDIVTWGYKYGE